MRREKNLLCDMEASYPQTDVAVPLTTSLFHAHPRHDNPSHTSIVLLARSPTGQRTNHEFREADWDGLIKTVHLTLLVASTDVRSVSIDPRGAEDQRDPILVDSETPAYITVEGEETHILEFVNRIKDEHHAPGDGNYDLKITSDDLCLRIPGRAPIPLRSLNIVLEHRTTSSEIVITSSKLEELLLHWHDGTKQVIYSEDLEKLSIDREKRTVVPCADKSPSGGT